MVPFPASHHTAIKWQQHVSFVNTPHEAIIYIYASWTGYLKHLAVSTIKAICFRNWIFIKKVRYGHNSWVIVRNTDNSPVFLSTNWLMVPRPSLRIADWVVSGQLIRSWRNVPMTYISIDFSWISNSRLVKRLSKNILYFLGLNSLVRWRTTFLFLPNKWVLWLLAGMLLVPIPPITSKPYK